MHKIIQLSKLPWLYVPVWSWSKHRDSQQEMWDRMGCGRRLVPLERKKVGTSYVFSFFKTLRLKSELWVKKAHKSGKGKKKKTCPLFLPDVTKDDCVKKLLVMNRFSYKVLCFNLKNVDRLWMLPKPWQKAVEDRRTMTLNWISLLQSHTNIRIDYTNVNVSLFIVVPKQVLFGGVKSNVCLF